MNDEKGEIEQKKLDMVLKHFFVSVFVNGIEVKNMMENCRYFIHTRRKVYASFYFDIFLIFKLHIKHVQIIVN